MDFFFLHILPLTTAFQLGCALFYVFYAKTAIFAAKKCPVGLQSTILMTKRLEENDIKTDVKTSKRRTDVMLPLV